MMAKVTPKFQGPEVPTAVGSTYAYVLFPDMLVCKHPLTKWIFLEILLSVKLSEKRDFSRRPQIKIKTEMRGALPRIKKRTDKACNPNSFMLNADRRLANSSTVYGNRPRGPTTTEVSGTGETGEMGERFPYFGFDFTNASVFCMTLANPNSACFGLASDEVQETFSFGRSKLDFRWGGMGGCFGLIGRPGGLSAEAVHGFNCRTRMP